MNNDRNFNKGLSILEALIYIAILSIVSVVIVDVALVMTKAYGSFRVTQNIERAGLSSLDRIIREIRDAESIDLSASVLGTHPGTLTLNTTDSSGNARTVEFYLQNEVISLKENGIANGALMNTNASTTNFIVRRIVNAHSEGVKIEMTISSGAKSENFYATAVLRNSY